MGSNYKKLGPYIQIVNQRNSSLSGHKLLGVSIKKCFMPSIANIIGTDMSTYKLIRKKQFAYGPVTSRNGDKISIAILDDLDEAIVSQAYTVFEIKDFNELDPEYLMMWFRRPEFDRYARFKSHGSAREIFDWTEMCETELPVPNIEKQREIVREYNTIVNRISLNEQLIQKLEETAQAIYKQWFVEFEFPSEALAKDGVPQPYKSSGGKMVWCEELDKEIPERWEMGTLEDLFKFQYGSGNNNPHNNGPYPIYGAGGIIGGFDKFNNVDAPVIGHMGAYCGAVNFAFGKHYVTYNGVMCLVKDENERWFSYLSLLSKDLMSHTRGSSQPFVSYDMLYEVETILPNKSVLIIFENYTKLIFNHIKFSLEENRKLLDLKGLILTKMAKVEETAEKEMKIR